CEDRAAVHAAGGGGRSRGSFEEGSQLAGGPRRRRLRGCCYGSKNSSGWMLPGSPKTGRTSRGDAMNWTRRWIAMALAAGLTAVFAAMAAPSASAAPPAGATTTTPRLHPPFPALNPPPPRHGAV